MTRPQERVDSTLAAAPMDLEDVTPRETDQTRSTNAVRATSTSPRWRALRDGGPRRQEAGGGAAAGAGAGGPWGGRGGPGTGRGRQLRAAEALGAAAVCAPGPWQKRRGERSRNETPSEDVQLPTGTRARQARPISGASGSERALAWPRGGNEGAAPQQPHGRHVRAEPGRAGGASRVRPAGVPGGRGSLARRPGPGAPPAECAARAPGLDTPGQARPAGCAENGGEREHLPEGNPGPFLSPTPSACHGHRP